MRHRISIFLGNTLYAAAFIYYTYITFLGYNCNSATHCLGGFPNRVLALQFLNKTQLLLIPIPVIVVLYIISLFGFHISKSVVEMYFRK
jgi:UNC-50 family